MPNRERKRVPDDRSDILTGPIYFCVYWVFLSVERCMWTVRMGERGEETVRGRESLRGVTENGVLRGLVFWILTSHFSSFLYVCAKFVTKCNDCVLMGD